MKNSTRYVWIVLAAIAALMIILTVMVRSMVNDHIVVGNSGEKGTYSIDFNSDSGPMISEEFDIDDFEKIRIVGGWDVLLIEADEYRISVDAGEKTVDDIVVEKRGDVLFLGLDYRNLKNSHEFHGASATVYMPALTDVNVDGAVNMNIEGFTGERVSFRLDGAGQIIGEDCVFEDLRVSSNGAINFDFSGSDTENVDVNIDGAGNIELNMTGGRLTGNLAGLSNLEYSGDVSLLDVEKDGIGGISKKD